jgi:MFS family permease
VEQAVVEPRELPFAASSVVTVWWLGLSQIIGYGTLYYSFSILAGSMAASFKWPVSWLYAAFSLALFLSGLVAPAAGHLIDRHGAGLAMTVGSAGTALTLFVAALSPTGLVFTAALIAMQATGALVLYDAAFAALVQAAGSDARQRIIHLTLIAGFASTIFWPLTEWLHRLFDWREIYLAFAAANLILCLPTHAVLARQRQRLQSTVAAQAPFDVSHQPAPPPALQRRLLWGVTLGFAFGGFALSAMLAQMVPVLAAVGVGDSALACAALFGPAQVLVRFVNMLVGGRRHPIIATLIGLAMLPTAIAILALSAPLTAGAALFSVLLGFGSGLKSIVQGTLPLALFGSVGYGARLGQMAAVRQALAAVAPFVLSFFVENLGASYGLWAMIFAGLLGLACMTDVAWLHRRRGWGAQAKA